MESSWFLNTLGELFSGKAGRRLELSVHMRMLGTKLGVGLRMEHSPGAPGEGLVIAERDRMKRAFKQIIIIGVTPLASTEFPR